VGPFAACPGKNHLLMKNWFAETSRELEFYEDETLPDYRLQHFFTIHG